VAPPLHVALVWHMHQPYYKDDLSNTFLLPWVRLRAAKDYYRMAALLDAYPDMRLTFNLVPSLIDQLEDYRQGNASDIYLDLSRRRADELSEEERAFVIRWMTESPTFRRVRDAPRYLELVQKREHAWPRPSSELARLFTDAEVRDLQVWFNLSWIDPHHAANDAVLRELVRKGRDFTEEDKEPILRTQLDLLHRTLGKYQDVQRRGQAELITSPYYHPILPLLCDVAAAREARTDLKLPRRRFAHPEDAAQQVRLAMDAHAKTFGARSSGLWPPEAAISEPALDLVAEQGLSWILSDEGVLARSLDATISRDGEGRVMRPDVLYSPYRVDRKAPLITVFRDAKLSNLIGFDYQNSAAEPAAADLVGRLHAIQERQDPSAPPLLVTLALDGENCWDFYEANGNAFLAALYGKLSKDPGLRLTTISEFLAANPPTRTLPRVVAGSWIDANLATWVGDSEHNEAWDLLSETRDFLGAQPESAATQRAWRELYIAEGSDWFWWFGRGHDSGMDVIWDSLYRLHLRNIYKVLNQQPPSSLFQPIMRPGDTAAAKRPDRKISPRLDGRPDENEWKAAGYLDVTALFGAMHPPRGIIRRVWFGCDDAQLYLRLDLSATAGQPSAELSIYFSGSAHARSPEPTAAGDGHRSGDFGFVPAYALGVRLANGQADLALRAAGQPETSAPIWSSQVAAGDTLAFGIPFAALNHDPGETLELVAAVRRGQAVVEQVPPAGSIRVRVPGDPFKGRPAKPLKILLVSAEVAPFAKVGGLADVAGALPKALKQLGHDVRVVMPRYGTIDAERYELKPVVRNLQVPLAQQTIAADVLEGRISGGVPVYFIENQQFFGREGMYGFWDDDARFIYFSRAALEMLKPLNFMPDVIHVNDWHTAVIPNMLARLYATDSGYNDIASVLTIHNLAFQGVFGYGTLHLANLDPWGLIKPGIPGLDDIVNLLGRGLYFCDAVNTVSNRYAEEILTPEYGERMDPLLRLYRSKLYGIINGIDYEVFNPSTDTALATRYDLDSVERKVDDKLALQKELGLPQRPEVPLIGLISRLYDQKGLDLIANIMWGLMRLDLQLVVLGAGEARYEEMFRANARDNPQKLSATIGFKPVLAQHIYAGSDMFLMPSRFEPCGLGQLISLRYGTIPIVRATGGLADTIHDWDPVRHTGNGFVFDAYDHWDLYAQVVRALENFRQPELWRALQRNAMRSDVSWANSAVQYVRLYQTAMTNHEEAREYAATPAGPFSW
jgi:starch synthase